jgi:roadblock/LC7 domain-containing protein
MTRLTATKRRQSGRDTSQQRTQALPQSRFLPVPTAGLDAISPLTSMKPDAAITIDNWFPQLRYIEIRRGHVEHSDTGEAGQPVESLMAYNAAVGTSDKLFAACNGEIFDVTTNVASSEVSALTNDRWQHINFATSGGNFLMCVNGADGVRYFDGSNWATATITGATAADLIHIAAFKARVWFVEKQSLDAWFLPPDSIQGKATRFPLGGTMKEGGFLLAIATWSLDGGDGPDDRIAFISSKGEVAIYAGTDPTNSATFQLQGVYKIGNPIGRRCFFRIGGDIAVVCIDGVVPLSKAMVVERGAALTVAITANIQPLLNSDARNFSDLFGWQLISYPRGTRAILNVPQLENETAIQYVMNTVSGAWCRFTGMNANCWEIFQDRVFFGGNDGVVMEADRGGDDNGEVISTDVSCAFNDCQEQRQKLFVMARPFIVSDGDVAPGIAINVDFRNNALVDTQPVSIDGGAEWDEAEWDVDEWPIEENLLADWVGLAAMEGNTVSIRMAVAAQSSGTGDVILQLLAFQILFIPGAYI